jgi:REase_DpnII-MboI
MLPVASLVAEDRSLYIRQGSAYNGILVFVWDDSRRTELHPGLIQGLKQINNVVDAVVVSRPGMMQTESS